MRLRRFCGLLALLALAGAAAGQSFPPRAVSLVVPNPPGGAIDIQARIYAQKLQELWGQPVIVDYKPGAVNGWPVEAHVAGSVDFRFQRKPKGINQLPYRMIVPLEIENLFVAGRCASMTHGGQSAARVSGPCFVMGQAAGTAAHLALKTGVAPRRLDVSLLQEQLERDGAYLGEAKSGTDHVFHQAQL